MRTQILLLIVAGMVAVSCASQPRKIDSPLFDKAAAPETPEELAALPKVTQKQIVRQISMASVQAEPPRPRTVLAANRKAPEPASAANEAPVGEDFTGDTVYYTATGSEKLSFVARAFLGTPSKAWLVKKWNPELKTKPLFAGQKVGIKLSALNPISIYLSRDFVTKYRVPLQKVLLKNPPDKEYIVQRGDTLQRVSQKLYETTRRWTELYILNYQNIPNPDSLEKGTKLRHY